MASPRELLVEACKQNTEVGSCTACLVSLDEKASVLSTANLGDSGYMILRQVAGKDKLEIVYESKEQQHAFNFPFQVGTNGDPPSSAEVNAHNVLNGDIIILGTDGLWDNMHRPKIVDLINPFIQKHPESNPVIIHQYLN